MDIKLKGHLVTWYKIAFAVGVNVMLNLSNTKKKACKS